MTTKTQQLTNRIDAILADYLDEVMALPKCGPRGGQCVNKAGGWVRSPSANITRACNNSVNNHLLVAKWDTGYANCVAAVPECMMQAMIDAEIEIWNS